MVIVRARRARASASSVLGISRASEFRTQRRCVGLQDKHKTQILGTRNDERKESETLAQNRLAQSIQMHCAYSLGLCGPPLAIDHRYRSKTASVDDSALEVHA